MSGQSEPLTRSLGARAIGAALVLLPVALATSKCSGFVRASSGTMTTDEHITVTSPWVAAAIGWSSVALALLAVGLSYQSSRPWAPRTRWARAGACVVAIALFVDMTTGWVVRSWQVAESRTAPDGRTLAVLMLPIWDKPHWAFAVESERTVFRTRYELVSPDGTEHAFPLSFVVRPASTYDDERMLWPAPDGTFVAVQRGGCWAAWNPAEHRAATIAELIRMSPFVLLDATSPGRDSDLSTIEWQFESARRFDAVSSRDLHAAAHPRDSDLDSPADGDRPIVPTELSLLVALDSANPWVRAAARRIVTAGGAEVYPEATRRIAAEPK